MTDKLKPHIDGFKQLGTLPSRLEAAIKDANEKLDAQGLFKAIDGAVNPAIEQAKTHFAEVAKLYRAEEAEVTRLAKEAQSLNQTISQYKGTPAEIETLRKQEAQLRQDYHAKEQELTRLNAAKKALEQRLSQQPTAQPTTNNQKSKLPLIIGGVIGAGALIASAIALSSNDQTYEEWLTRPVQQWEQTTDKPGFLEDKYTLTVRTDQLTPPHKFEVVGQQTAEGLKRYIVQDYEARKTTPKQAATMLAYMASLDGNNGITDLDLQLQREMSRLQFRLSKDNIDANKREYTCVIVRERTTDAHVATVIGDNTVQSLKDHFFGNVPYKATDAKTDRDTRVPDTETIILELQKMGKRIDASTVAKYKR